MVVYHHTQEGVVDADHSVVAEEDVGADVLKMGRTLQGLGIVVIIPHLLRMMSQRRALRTLPHSRPRLQRRLMLNHLSTQWLTVDDNRGWLPYHNAWSAITSTTVTT
jgi:hypothetical protein